MKQLSTQQMVNLFNIAIGSYYNYVYEHVDEMSVNYIMLEDSGFRLRHFKIVQYPHIDVRFGDVYDFEYFTTDLRSDNKNVEIVKNNKLLQEKLYEFGFYATNIE